jgi:hypothetical protein
LADARYHTARGSPPPSVISACIADMGSNQTRPRLSD